MTGALAAHYARALADAVFAPDSGLDPREAVAQLKSAAETIGGSAELKEALISPAVSREAKINVVRTIAGDMQVHRLIQNLLLVVVDHRRVKEISAIDEAFEAAVDERTGWIPADIASAHPLGEQEREQVERALGTKLGKFIRARYSVDPNLLAGVRARVAGTEYDATLRGKLEGLRHRLSAPQ